MFKQFTLGIEQEFQIVDPHTRELRSHVSEILEEGKMLLGEQVKPEMIQSMILLLRRAAFSAWRFTDLFPIRMREHIAGLTLKNLANLLQRFKINS